MESVESQGKVGEICGSWKIAFVDLQYLKEAIVIIGT